MPRGDGTGPAGMGSMTGRAAGYCAGFNTPGFANPVPGRGFWGAGRSGGFGGGGRGHRYMYYATGLPGWARYSGAHTAPYAAQPFIPTTAPGQELDYLKNQAEYFQKTLGDINQRIEELEKESKNK